METEEEIGEPIFFLSAETESILSSKPSFASFWLCASKINFLAKSSRLEPLGKFELFFVEFGIQPVGFSLLFEELILSF